MHPLLINQVQNSQYIFLTWFCFAIAFINHLKLKIHRKFLTLNAYQMFLVQNHLLNLDSRVVNSQMLF